MKGAIGVPQADSFHQCAYDMDTERVGLLHGGKFIFGEYFTERRLHALPSAVFDNGDADLQVDRCLSCCLDSEGMLVL